MIEPVQPKYREGQRVCALADLYNDGTYPDLPVETLLVNKGTVGEVVQCGRHEEMNIPVYMVDFETKRVVGCLEEELAPAS